MYIINRIAIALRAVLCNNCIISVASSGCQMAISVASGRPNTQAKSIYLRYVRLAGH